MDERAILAMTMGCFAIGVLSWCIPLKKYSADQPVGSFSIPLLILATILMTTFKWSSVAIEISGLKTQISQAREEAEMLRLAMEAKDAALLALRQDVTTDTATSAITDAVGSTSTVSLEQTEDVIRRLKDSGFTITPASELEKKIDEALFRLDDNGAPQRFQPSDDLSGSGRRGNTATFEYAVPQTPEEN